MKVYSDDPETFDAVYAEVFPLLMRVSYHITLDTGIAEDICQEAFIRFYHRTLPFPSEEQARYWLIRVAKNLSFNYYNRSKRERKAMEDYLRQPRPLPVTGEEALLLGETEKIVHAAVRKLPEKLRSPLILKEYGGLSYREIAKILRISEGNVKVRIFRARSRLAEQLSEEEIYVR
jgi:RNA polymerase sigma-70 factor (ECF subfamily)